MRSSSSPTNYVSLKAGVCALNHTLSLMMHDILDIKQDNIYYIVHIEDE